MGGGKMQEMLLLASVSSAVGDVYIRPETITADLSKDHLKWATLMRTGGSLFKFCPFP